MLDTTTLEQRLLVLEAEVAALKQQAKSPSSTGKNWLEKLTGSISDEAGFEQVLAYGRAFRDRDRPEDVDEIPATN
jgi:hypothetical protein